MNPNKTENRNADYQIVRMKRRTIALHLLQDGTLEVRAPHRVSEKVLSEFVENKRDWIQKAKERQAQAVVLPTFSDKEIHEMKEATKNRIDGFLQDFHGLKPQKVNIRKQKSVWGTCNKKGTISINAFCCLLPEPLFQYIMIHELCHLVELNHSIRFWALVSSYLPDWKATRAELNKFRIGQR